MHPSPWALAGAALLTALAAGVLWRTGEGPSTAVPGLPGYAGQASPSGTAAPPAAPQAPPLPATAALPPGAGASGARSATGIFESDDQGRLVVDERMRLAVERLVGMHPADALPALVESEVRGLPPAAAQAARELALRFDEYQAAQRAAFTPGQAPLVPQEGLAELDALVALRTSYFGADAARRMFGADEAVARRLLQLMAEDQATNLSMEQKAQRAQLRYDRERGAVPAPR